MNRRLTAFLFFLVLVSITFGNFAGAQDKVRELEGRLRTSPDDQATLMELGVLYHDLGMQGDDDAVEKAFTCFDRLLALDSTNAVALVYRGSLWTLRARDAWWPPTKLKYLREGGKEMDRAVDMAHDDMMVRLTRGINSLNMPEKFGGLETALEDFIILLKHPEFPNQTRQLKAAVFYYGGVAFRRADDYDRARELFRKAIVILPGSDFARRAQDELSDMDS